ncbi:hypothetical protein Ae201684_005573 [Aphanomyces euteiches]|uniref:Uncharacterized protein n=1 Tax=Aphanomyces euteiches TaxID=100861 RepID=A0A6G0XEZ2_9STRA|nr:hypothetical protein Ae201684_005573 [Aphanomyces euteiches]
MAISDFRAIPAAMNLFLMLVKSAKVRFVNDVAGLKFSIDLLDIAASNRRTKVLSWLVETNKFDIDTEREYTKKYARTRGKARSGATQS